MNVSAVNHQQPQQKKENWFSQIPKKIEGLQKTGQLFGLNREDSFSASPIKELEQQSSKDQLKVFSKRDFRIDQLLKNFYNQFEKTGIHDYLVNRLYSYNEADLNFYMAELCYLYITRDSESLQKFLIDMSARSINLYLLIYWSLDAFSDALKTNLAQQQQYERIQKLLNILITYTYQQKTVETAFQEGSKDSNQSPTKKPNGKEKEQRTKYNNSIKVFIKNMVNISLTLKKHEPDERKDKLKMYMKRSDKWLQQLREKNPFFVYKEEMISFKEYLYHLEQTIIHHIVQHLQVIIMKFYTKFIQFFQNISKQIYDFLKFLEFKGGGVYFIKFTDRFKPMIIFRLDLKLNRDNL